MLLVCRDHVKEGLKQFEVPHVKEVKYSSSLCPFCKNQAQIKIFYSVPLSKGYIKKIKGSVNMKSL